MTNELEKIIERCRVHPKKLERCFLLESNLKECNYVGDMRKSITRDKYSNPQIITYYLCEKPK